MVRFSISINYVMIDMSAWMTMAMYYLFNSDWYVVQILCRPRWLSGWSVGVALRVIFWCSPHTAPPLWNKNVIFGGHEQPVARHEKYSWSTSTLFPPMDDPALPWQPLSPQPLSSQNEPQLPKQALPPKKWAYHPTMCLWTTNWVSRCLNWLELGITTR